MPLLPDAPWKAKGEALFVAPLALAAPALPPPRNLRIKKPATTITSKASRPNIKILPKASPNPSDEASQARPKPAARPPSIAPHGFFGATPAAGVPGRAAAALLLAGAAAVLLAVLPAPAGAAPCCWVTLGDCLPMDLPPPKRLASAMGEASAKLSASTADKTVDVIFMGCLQVLNR